MIESTISQTIEAKSEKLTALSDAIWEHPETGYRETFASKAYADFLLSEGFRFEKGLAGIETAFCGSFGSGRPVIGILGEFDALPNMSQEADCTQKNPVVEGGAGHACGHNLLGVGSLAAAVAVKSYLEENPGGTVKFFGCPAEEGGAGKTFMAREGIFDDLDIALTWHPGDSVSVHNGSMMANYQVCYKFTGKSSHASIAPELGRSALDGVELMNVGVQFLREHVKSDVRIHYAFTNAGGTSPGIVQPYAEVLYLMRAPQIYQAEEVYDRVNDIAKGAALMTGTTVEAEFVKACSNILVNSVLVKQLQKSLDRLGGITYTDEEYAYAETIRDTMNRQDGSLVEMIGDVDDPAAREAMMAEAEKSLHGMVIPYIAAEQNSAASSDVGDVSWVCPCAQFSATTMPAGTPMHSWQQVAVGKNSAAHKGMLYAGKVMALTAVDLLQDPGIVEKAKAEHMRRTCGHSYQSPIPSNVKPKIW